MPQKRIKKECYICFNSLIKTNKCRLPCGHCVCYICIKSMIDNKLNTCGLCRAQISTETFTVEIKRVADIRRAKKKKKPTFVCCDRKYDKMLAIPWKCGHKYCVCCYHKLCIDKYKVTGSGFLYVNMSIPCCIKCDYKLQDDLGGLNPITRDLLFNYSLLSTDDKAVVFNMICTMYLKHKIRNKHMVIIIHDVIADNPIEEVKKLVYNIAKDCTFIKCSRGNPTYIKYADMINI